MKKLATLFVAVLLLAASSALAANQVRISQVYGGGGASSTTTVAYQNDFVEVFNSGGTAVNIGGWTLEYGSATGNFGSSSGNIFTFPAGTMIQPCSYLLVVSTSSVSGNGPSLTASADFTCSFAMGATSGKVGLFSVVNTNIACGSITNVVDMVGWGAATCYEGSAAAPAPSTTTADIRANGGLQDNDQNSTDFTAATPTPRNAASAQNAACLATPTLSRTWGSLKSIYR